MALRDCGFFGRRLARGQLVGHKTQRTSTKETLIA
jgi:hypothetical protein